MRYVAKTQNGAPAPNDQFFPWMDVDPEGGLHAIWFDNRQAPANVAIKTWQGSAGIDGTTWKNHNISTESWNPNQSFFSSGAFFGDYNGFAAGNDVMYPLWTDGRNTPGSPLGQTDVYTNVELNGFP